jgi:hypothetical protein
MSIRSCVIRARRALWLVPLTAVLVALGGCGSDDCSSEIEAARDFLASNRGCQTDTDCVAVPTGCHTFRNGVCGQAPLNRQASESPTWANLSRNLNDCMGNECEMCLAALATRCTNGVCGGEP